MKYVLLIHGNQKTWDDVSASWSRDDIRAMIAFMRELGKDLADSGELVDTQGLGGPAYARTVRAQPDGDPVVTDGPYPEAKEVLISYWVVDVKSPERAVEIAARISATPGRGGVPVNQPVEVHPVMEAPEV